MVVVADNSVEVAAMIEVIEEWLVMMSEFVGSRKGL